jgi:multidrug transporter EmrE-like cation transporter
MSDIVERLLDDDAARFGVAMGAIETFADYCLKRYAQTDNPDFLAGGVSGYGAIVYVFQRALRKESLGRTNAWWNAFTTVSNVIVGTAMGEKYSHTQLLGFAMVAGGILLV